jgi:hypothetical protein|tara:strand:- start:74 stop:247 length:174 start_codon:yes stop_codon:yes gene_type:complete
VLLRKILFHESVLPSSKRSTRKVQRSLIEENKEQTKRKERKRSEMSDVNYGKKTKTH